MRSGKRQKVLVDVHIRPDDRGRFRCCIDGYIVWRSIEQIKQAIADGDDVRETKVKP